MKAAMIHQSNLGRRVSVEDLPGPPDPFRDAAVECYPRLQRVAARMVDEQSAVDLVQETFTRAFAKRSSFRQEASPSTWFHSILINLCRAELRRRRVKSWLSLQWLLEKGSPRTTKSLESPTNTPPELIEKQEHQGALHRAIQQLPENQRAALVLVSLEGLPAKDAAQILETSEAAVWKSLSRARATLRRTLS